MLSDLKTVLKVLGGAGLAFALGSSGALAETFRLAHHHAVGGTVDIAANRFAEAIDSASDGRIKVLVFPAAQLGQEREAYDLVEQGGIDISITTTSFLDKNYPPIALTTMPFIFSDWDHAMSAYDGEFGDTIRDNVREASNTEILAYLGVGFRSLFFTDEPPVEMADMSRVKMRSPENYVYIKMFELMGAVPTPVTWGEVYTAMQTGVAEGFDAPPGVAVDSKLHEVSRGVLVTNHMYSAMVFAMNKDKFNNLSADDQELMVSAAQEAAHFTNVQVTIPAEEAAFNTFLEAGMTVAEPADIVEWRNAMKPLIDEVVADNPGADTLLELLGE